MLIYIERHDKETNKHGAYVIDINEFKKIPFTTNLWFIADPVYARYCLNNDTQRENFRKFCNLYVTGDEYKDRHKEFHHWRNIRFIHKIKDALIQFASRDDEVKYSIDEALSVPAGIDNLIKIYYSEGTRTIYSTVEGDVRIPEDISMQLICDYLLSITDNFTLEDEIDKYYVSISKAKDYDRYIQNRASQELQKAYESGNVNHSELKDVESYKIIMRELFEEPN